MTERWLTVNAAVIADAAKAIALAEHGDGTVEVPRALLTGLVEYLSDDLGCDHSVGICMCGEIDLVRELNLALEGKRTCHQCGGDGMGYDPVKAEAERKLYDPEYGYYATDYAGLIDCPGCDGKGVASY